MSEPVDIRLNFAGFDYNRPQYSEVTLLNPQIEKLGLRVVKWIRLSKDKKTGEVVRAAVLSNEQLITYSYYD